MYFIFLWEVVKRAFTPAPRVTDMLQILAASALPATSRFVGIELPQNAGESALAYIGLIAVSFIIIRLFWAPYAIWRGQAGEVAGLKLELSKPERLVVEHLARHKAEAIQELKDKLVEAHLFNLAPIGDDAKVNRLLFEIEKLIFRAGLSPRLHGVFERFLEYIRGRKPGSMEGFDEFKFLADTIACLEGGVTIEHLARQLPQGTGQGTQL